jgi:hypothetical protein
MSRPKTTARPLDSTEPEHDILMRNRRNHLRDRDVYYQRAVQDLQTLVDQLQGLRESSGGLQQLREQVELLALDFKRALAHAILAAGGDLGRTRVAGISREEMVFSDYLKTMYSSARNIESYLSHELMLVGFCESGQEPPGPLVSHYILQSKSYDQDIILRTVDLMMSRVALFNNTFLQPPRQVAQTDELPEPTAQPFHGGNAEGTRRDVPAEL